MYCASSTDWWCGAQPCCCNLSVLIAGYMLLYDSTMFYVSSPLLLDYELFPVLTTVNNVAVKILVHVMMHVAKNSSRTRPAN